MSTTPYTELRSKPRKTGNQFHVVHGQGSADLLKVVVVLVENPGHIPSPNGVPLQSAAFGSNAGKSILHAECVSLAVSPGTAVCWTDTDNPATSAITWSGTRRFNRKGRTFLFPGSSPANLLCSPRHRRRKTFQKCRETLRSFWKCRHAGSPRFRFRSAECELL
jgi:hypothetical protein